jgi:transcriptional regulator with XRE-family HTH domain
MAGSVVIDGKLLAYAAISRKLALRGVRLSRQAIHMIFTGKQNPRYAHFKALAEVLGLTLDELDDLIERVRAGKFYRVGY